MNDQQSLEALREIRQMMDRSSRFISLSGWSGVAAGTCALIAAWFAHGIIRDSTAARDSYRKLVPDITSARDIPVETYLGNKLLIIAIITLVAALVLAFLFTWLRSRNTNTPIWSPLSRKVLWALILPLAVGGIYLLQLMQAGAYGFIAPGCLLFYGLGLINVSRFTVNEIKYLGYGQIITGLISLFNQGNGLYFWAFGFGVLHIVYGLLMWWKHERKG